MTDAKTIDSNPAANSSTTRKSKASAQVPAKQATTTAKVAVQEVIKPKPATPTAAPAGTGKPKHKLVRDSFTIPKSEYAVLDALKLRAANLKRPTKKSEVLRAGIGALAKLSDKAFLAALESVPVLKTGRPQKAPPAKS